ncbi:hypothetical protein ACFO4O_07840 [Glaciecola siphonariae]|uniref:Type II secretion system protein K n=1 Tax=Glaciecola siphonariae TaxID=521012 RepID=A0ABV9LU84_9ALTE
MQTLYKHISRIAASAKALSTQTTPCNTAHTKTTYRKTTRLKTPLGTKGHKQQSGAVLIMVLVVLVSLSIAISVATRIINERLTTALDSRQHIEGLMQAHAKTAELTYLLATQARTIAGVSRGSGNNTPQEQGAEQNRSIRPIGDEIRTDGYIYVEQANTPNELRYSIQNEAGLLSINSGSQFWLQAYLDSFGLNRLTLQSLLDTLADYADENDIRRAAGAESFSYKSSTTGINGSGNNINSRALNNSSMIASSRLPRNYLLQSCGELYLVNQWSQRPDIIKAITPVCSVLRRGQLNINAMPSALLRVLFPKNADAIIAQREQGEWLLTENDVINAISDILSYNPDFYSVFGGSEYRINVYRAKDEGILIQRRVKIGQNKLTPFAYR